MIEVDPLILENLRAIRQDISLLEQYTPDQLEDIRELHNYAMRECFDYYAEVVAPDFCKPHHDPAPSRHHRLLIYWLNQLAAWDGTGKVGIKRLMIWMPPGSAKSTYTARIWLSWMMMRNEFSECILTSASSTLVDEHSERIQKLAIKYGDIFKVKLLGCRGEQLPAKGNWKLDNKSSLLAVSAGTDFQGFRGDIIIADDPVGGVEDMTDGKREAMWQWFDQNMLGRISDGLSRIVVIMTRWNDDDICGRILREKGREGWTIISLPAIWEYEHDEPEFPLGLGRKIDITLAEPLRDERLLLWPQYHGFERYDEARKGAEIKFQAQYQCNPLPPGGVLFQADKINPSRGARRAVKMVRAWDFAASKKKGADYTCSVKMQVDAFGHYNVLHRTKDRLGPHEARAAVMDFAKEDGPNCYIAIPKDPGQAGSWQAQDLVAGLAGFKVEVYSQTGSKEDRAKPFASQVNGENVSAEIADWNRDFVDELRGFPNLQHDDQVDAASMAFGSLLDLPKLVRPPRWSHGNHLSR